MGAAISGVMPRMIRHCLARYLPSSFHPSLLDCKVGTTTLMTGMGGLYLDTRLAVRPDWANTMIRPALIFSALRTADDAMDSTLDM